ncbi:GNAT family N-acetyltransferase [Rickettsiales bacterium]|nr:GNAT family N-acetyltransferase [Rickettsiales bacterium]
MSTKKLVKKNIKIKVDEDIFLRVLKLDDVAEPYVEWLNDYEVTKFTEQKYFKHTLKSTKNFVSQKYDSENDLLFGIFFDDTHIGNIKLGPIKFDHMSAEVSYFIGEKRFWGRGIASKCIKTIIQLAVTELGLKKINAGYYENNIVSAKVLKKCGFVVEGIKISEIIFESKRINSVLVGYVLNDLAKSKRL